MNAQVTAEWIATCDFTIEFPQRYEDDYLRGDASAREAFISDAVSFG